ncbi:DNA polymerase Y family protein [Microbacterium sp. ARD31]|uniref:DNA polymerase Y family protein n=1 Tax=Microbacterium sp. ARD31 TaxID=2962576 RepID=UPI002880C287|nr:DNA polymerase Y family protein [Microbacterium sp. ARD31]MDT0180238.1 DNA polymerase Y family protein [Microbacterium sp. ARD31]
MTPDAARAPERSLVLWFPDWPVTAYLREKGRAADAERPLAVMANNLVVACSALARAEGVRRGQRRRDAQARCPRLTVVPADEARDHRAFAPVLTRIEEHAPGVQVVRPGLCALRARGPARYYGGEERAARLLRDVLGGDGLSHVRAAVADGPFTAEQAAMAATSPAEPVFVVPAGASAGFLAPLPVSALAASSLVGDLPGAGAGAGARAGSGARGRASGSARGGGDLVSLLARLGVQTLGQFAAMETDRVRERFGPHGVRVHALAGGRDSQPVTPRTPPPELHREVAFEPPLEIAEQIAFGMRIAAEEFIARLGAEDLVCTELRVELTGDRGERSERVWLHPASFDASAVVDRVRWQLAEESAALRSGVALVRISPEAVDAASHHAPAIFGSGPEERVHHALSRVQAMLGHRGVLTPDVGGGRWLAERQVLVPWGDRPPQGRAGLAAEREQPWPGRLPDPLPSTVFTPTRPVEVTSLGGYAVDVDERGVLSAVPAQLGVGGRQLGIDAWAGPWPVVERGWDAVRARRAHRFQVVDTEGTAWLLVCEGPAWHAEAVYD